ncbi:retrovirus-related pol polyprotein from transposon TNT 1-94 [Tanacetum coccineum]
MAQLARLPIRVKGKHLSLKHNLDVMYIEKNVLESILNTLLMNEKSKDTTKARQELKRLGIQSGSWLGQNKNGKCSKPQAAYSFTPENRKMLCQFIKGVKLPDGFGSNFKDKQYLPADIAKPIIELCSFFKQICSQTLMEDGMLKAQSKVVDILCNLELIYPSGLFDIMIHLVIHFPLEALEGGPIRPWWMVVAEEAMTFSSYYFRDVTTKFNRPDRNVDCPPPTCQFQFFRSVCKSIGLRSVIRIDHQELKKVIWYVLHNSPEIDTYRAKFKSEFTNKDMKEEFPGWFGSQIRQRHIDKDPGVSASSELFALACRPTPTPISINSCIVNGVWFAVHSRDKRRTTQNNSICLLGEDREMYYGQLEEILEFSYMSFKIVFDQKNNVIALKDDLRKLKGKALVDNVVTKYAINPEMLKIDVEPITPTLLNKRTAHFAYIKHTQEETAVLRDLVEHVKSNYPLDHSLESACRLSTSASGSHPSGNNKKNKIQRPSSSTLKNKVEAHPRTVKSSLKHKNCVVKPKETTNVQHSKINVNSELLCVKCNGYMLSPNHDLCVLDFINNVNAHAKSKSRPTGQTFTIVGNVCLLTRITTTAKVPLRKPTAQEYDTSKPVVTLVYSRKPRKSKTNVPVNKLKIIISVVQIVLWYLDSGCSKHMTGDRSQLTNFVNKFLGTVKFENDHVAKIFGYGDYHIGNVTILRVYYVEGLGHNLFSVGQFCDSNLEVAFSRHGLVRVLPKLKFEKDHMCSACAMGKSTKKPHKPKSKETNQEKLYLLHMDLCGPMRVASVNGKKYILVIVDDSRFTWVKCLRSIDEATDFIIKFLKMIQVRLKTPV